jgi:hypothetical protein
MPPFNKEGRFRVEIRDHNRAYVRTLPYRNLQGEWFIGPQGAQIRFDSTYREIGLTASQFEVGKHEIWLWDSMIPGYPIFQGPATLATADTTDGSLNIQASDYLWYFGKRLLLETEYYTGKPENAMSDLLTFTNGRRDTGVVASIEQAGTQDIAALLQSGDMQSIADAWDDVSQMGDGVDYYIRGDGATAGDPILHLWGAYKKPTPKPIKIEYPGGALESATYEQQGSGLGNFVVIIGSGAGFTNYGTAVNATKITEYDAQFEIADDASQNTNASLNHQAAVRLKKTQSTLLLPTLVVKSEHYNPFVDFDLGDRFTAVISDEWVQYSGPARAIGMQITVGENDEVTTNIYTNDEEEIT